MIELERLTFFYPHASEPALHDISLSLGCGVHGVIGPSGSGKSTFLRLFNGLVPHRTGGRLSGDVRVLRRSILRDQPRSLARLAGLLFQDAELQGIGATVEADIAFGPENLGVSRSEITRRIDAALHQCGIVQLRHRTLATLSGGERQLAALAAVIAMDQQIVCLDEPLAQLDTAHRNRILATCAELAGSGKTILVGEHHTQDIARLTDSLWTVGTTGAFQAIAPQAQMPTAPPRQTGDVAWALESADIGLEKPLLRGTTAAGYFGQVIAVTGSNGSGKTTLLRSIAGLIPLRAGRSYRTADQCAYLPQNPGSLLWRKSIRAEVEATLRHRVGGDVDETLELFALTAVASRYHADLSTGERQRAALAVLLAGNPRLVLLDEPTRGMDGAAFALLLTTINRAAENGACVVLATHDRDLVEASADVEMRILDDGIVISDNTRTSTGLAGHSMSRRRQPSAPGGQA